MKRALAVALLLMSFAAVALPVGPSALSLRQAKKPEAGAVRIADGSDPPAGTPAKPAKPNLAV
jgi:hypothetical protein